VSTCDSACLDQSATVLSTTTKVERKSSLKRRSNKPKRSLRFCDERNQVFAIPHLDNMSDETIARIWYDSEEYAEIKSSYQMTIFHMEKGEFQEDDEHTSRGLEYRTQDGAWARYENKRDAYNAVLDEQDRQWKVDQDDHQAIGRVYLEHSTKCAIAAAERGAQDHKEAKEICKDLLKKRRTNRKKSKHKLEGVKLGGDISQEPEPPAAQQRSAPPAAKVRELLRQRSARGRDLIRNDIEKQQAKMKKEKSQRLLVRSY